MSGMIEGAVSIDDRASVAKESKSEMEGLIEDYKPFLSSQVAKYSSRFDESQREELLGSAMLGFYEAVQNFNVDKGHFFPFANRLVYERIIDCIRKIQRHSMSTISIDQCTDMSFSIQTDAVTEISMRFYDAEHKQQLLANEIDQFKTELGAWGITLEDLSRQSPKHEKLREAYKQAIIKIYQDSDIMRTIRRKRYFPVKAISKVTGLDTKKLERARTFILASLIIKAGDYDYLSDYV